MPPVAGPVRVRGFGETRRRLGHFIRELPEETARAAKAEFEIEKRAAQRDVPKRSRALERSHVVSEPEIRGGVIHVELTAGSAEVINDRGIATEEYAWTVHEDLEAFHANGHAKWLELTLNASRPYMARRIANRVDLRRAVGR